MQKQKLSDAKKMYRLDGLFFKQPKQARVGNPRHRAAPAVDIDLATSDFSYAGNRNY